MEPCESKTPLYLFSHPPTLDLEEAGGEGRAVHFPSTIKPVLSGHPGEWRTDCLIQVDLLMQVWQIKPERIFRKNKDGEGEINIYPTTK